MTLSYPLSLPATPGLRSARLVARDTITAFEGAAPIVTTAAARKGGRWELSATVPPMTLNQAGAWIGFFTALRGSFGVFVAGDPDYTAAAGASALTAVRVNGAAQTGRQLAVDGLTPTTTAAVAAGDYFHTGAGLTARLYRVLEDADSNGSGEATLEVFPAVASPADDAVLNFSAPVGLFQMAPGVLGEWTSDRTAVHRGFEIRAIGAPIDPNASYRLLEDGFYRLLEDGSYRKLEGST